MPIKDWSKRESWSKSTQALFDRYDALAAAMDGTSGLFFEFEGETYGKVDGNDLLEQIADDIDTATDKELLGK